MEAPTPYLTLSSRALHSLLTFHPPILTKADHKSSSRMTTYARPSPPPINTLPVELLSYIFVLGTHCTSERPLPDDVDPTPAFTAESVKTPLTLASVSRYWRRVALSTPRLWTSICVTMQMIAPVDGDGPSSCPTAIDVRHITSYLALSRQYPIDVLIDARDYEWDFIEEGISPAEELETYSAPFSPSHMKTVFDLLVPHISRWRTLSILTDTWSPMRTALQSINAPLLEQGAPMLESLALMRCNDFISFGSEFQPASLKTPAFLSASNALSLSPSTTTPNILPRLRHLSLRGVHVDWASLSMALLLSKTGLHSLELGSHCADVRPSFAEFHHLLTASPRLQKLVVSGSGPFMSDNADEGVRQPQQQQGDGILLPSLANLNLGYRSAAEAQVILQLVDAPSLTSLTLEEATYPADPDVVDASSILTYLGTGEFLSPKERYLSAFDTVGKSQYQFKPRKDSTSSIASTSTCVGSSIEIEGRLFDDDDDMTLVDFDTKPHPPFPLLESVTLKGVKASSSAAVNTFIGSLSRVRRLELADMSSQAVEALILDPLAEESSRGPNAAVDSTPDQPLASSSTLPALPLPCPQLQTLSIRNVPLHFHGLNFILNRLVPERRSRGGCRVEDIDIHLLPGAPVTSCQVELGDGPITIGEALLLQSPVTFGKAGVAVNLYQPKALEEDEDMEMDSTLPPSDTYYTPSR